MRNCPDESRVRNSRERFFHICELVSQFYLVYYYFTCDGTIGKWLHKRSQLVVNRLNKTIALLSLKSLP